MAEILSAADAESWLVGLGAALPRHAAVLRALVDGVRTDPRVVLLVVGCSIGRGAGDALSDLDCSISLESDAWPEGLDLVEPLVRSVGDVVDLLHHRYAGAGTDDHRRTAVQYADGVQLDLMVWPVTTWSGMHPPDAVVLHQTRPVFTAPWDPARGRLELDRLREWCFLGWWMLLDADKYLRRGSAWEARQRVEEARDIVWRLAAAAQRLPFPEYGITALLDATRPDPPDAMATLARLDLAELRAAVLACAVMLHDGWLAAALAVDPVAPGPEPPALAAWARARLSAQEDAKIVER